MFQATAQLLEKARTEVPLRKVLLGLLHVVQAEGAVTAVRQIGHFRDGAIALARGNSKRRGKRVCVIFYRHGAIQVLCRRLGLLGDYCPAFLECHHLLCLRL